MHRVRCVNDWQHQRNVEEAVLVGLRKRPTGIRAGNLRYFLARDHEFLSALKRLECQGRAQYVPGAGWIEIDKPAPREDR